MKKFFLATIAALTLTGAAHATTYSVDVVANPYRQTPATSGLQTRAVSLSPTGPQSFNGATYGINLTNVGDTVTRAVFGLIARDAPIDPDDLLPRPSTATFTIGTHSATVQGVSYAVNTGPSLPSLLGYAFVDYGAPIVIRVAPGLGIVISLADTVFGTNSVGQFTMDRPGFAAINATFTLAAIPVPAGLPLALTGVGMLAFAARRRKAKATLAA